MIQQFKMNKSLATVGRKISLLRWESGRREEKKAQRSGKKIQIIREKSHHFDRQTMGYHITESGVQALSASWEVPRKPESIQA